MAMPKFSSLTCISLVLILGICFLSFLQLSLAQTNEDLATYSILHRSAPGAINIQPNGPKTIKKQKQCEEEDGFLPCSDSILGNLFLFLVYGFIIYQAARIISFSNELLLSDWVPGIIGALLDILGGLPDVIVILLSGLASSAEDADDQVLVGMGLLAGSSIMWLTLLWGTCLVVGRCDRENDTEKVKDGTLTRQFDLFNTGVYVDPQYKIGAWIMTLTVVPFIIAQIPDVLNLPQFAHFCATLSCVLAFLGLFCYFIYQIVDPTYLTQRMYLARARLARISLLQRALTQSGDAGGLLSPDKKTPNQETIKEIYQAFDEDNNGKLSAKELKAFILGLEMSSDNFDMHVPIGTQAENFVKQFDRSRDGFIEESEFIRGISKWVLSVINNPIKKLASTGVLSSWWERSMRARRHMAALLDADEEGDGDESDDEIPLPTRRTIILKGIMLNVVGAVIATVFSDPLVDTITNLSDAINISPFFISFVATPVLTNSSDIMSAIIFCVTKKEDHISNTHSQIYGSVTLSNTLSLGVFLAIVVVRRLTWNYSSEVTAIAAVTIVIGIIGGTRAYFPFWMGLFALALYPVYIGMVIIFDSVLGWT